MRYWESVELVSNADGSVDEVEMITIPKKEYDSLVEDSDWLSCLESAGVDNWGGIDYAYELKEEDKEEDEE